MSRRFAVPAVKRRSGDRWSRIGTGAVRLTAVVVVAAAALAGCGKGEENPPGSAPPSGQLGASPTLTTPPTTPAAPTSAPVLADGEHVAYLTGLDVAAKTITFDLIEFLTGDAAKKACVDHKGPECPPPNDYFIVNDNPKLRTLPISATVDAAVLDDSYANLFPIALSDLPAHFAKTKSGKLLSPLPFRLTVTDGTVVVLKEMFLP
jgi:hypothetical protein